MPTPVKNLTLPTGLSRIVPAMCDTHHPGFSPCPAWAVVVRPKAAQAQLGRQVQAQCPNHPVGIVPTRHAAVTFPAPYLPPILPYVVGQLHPRPDKA